MAKEQTNFSSTTIWILVLLALLIGGVIGYLIGVNSVNATITGKVVDTDSEIEILGFENACLKEGVSEMTCGRLMNFLRENNRLKIE